MKLFNYYLCIAAGFVLMACGNNEPNELTNSGNTPLPEGTANISVTIKGSNFTRLDGNPIDGTPAENKISKLEFYVFESDGERDTERSYVPIADYAGGKINFAVNAGLNKKVVVAANMNLGEMATKNYAEVKKTISDLELDNTNSRVIPTSGIPMSGEGTVDVVQDVLDNKITIEISRLFAKVFKPAVINNVPVDIDMDELKEIFGDEIDQQPVFKLDSYALINGIDNSDAFDNMSTWDRTGRQYLLSGFTADVNANLNLAYSGLEGTGNYWLSGEEDESEYVFAYENVPLPKTVNGVSGFDRNTVYAFLIKGSLEYDQTEEDRYWRVNLIRDDMYKIYRNTVYKVTINKITTAGYATAKEAEEDNNNGHVVPGEDQTGILATIEVAKWNLKTQETDM